MSGSRLPRSSTSPVSYYVDADTLGLAHQLVLVRGDVTFPGDPGGTVRGVVRPACPVTNTATKDVDWIPVVAGQGWIIITRDKAIRRRPAEAKVVKQESARLFAITSPETLTVWHQLEILLSRWRDIEHLGGTVGPWMYTLTRTTCRQIL